MKKIKYILLSAMMLYGLAYTIVNAYSGGWEDNRVNYIYWSQGNNSKMFWTGVTNKVSYDQYKPCVGPDSSEYKCGLAAHKDQYKEYGSWINNSSTGAKIVHGLQAQSGQTLEYRVVVTASPSDY